MRAIIQVRGVLENRLFLRSGIIRNNQWYSIVKSIKQ